MTTFFTGYETPKDYNEGTRCSICGRIKSWPTGCTGDCTSRPAASRVLSSKERAERQHFVKMLDEFEANGG